MFEIDAENMATEGGWGDFCHWVCVYLLCVPRRVRINEEGWWNHGHTLETTFPHLPHPNPRCELVALVNGHCEGGLKIVLKNITEDRTMQTKMLRRTMQPTIAMFL